MELFGSTRDAWIAEDLEGWLAANEIYEGVPAIVKHLRSAGAFYIVTTKQVWHSPVVYACGSEAQHLLLHAEAASTSLQSC